MVSFPASSLALTLAKMAVKPSVALPSSVPAKEKRPASSAVAVGLLAALGMPMVTVRPGSVRPATVYAPVVMSAQTLSVSSVSSGGTSSSASRR